MIKLEVLDSDRERIVVRADEALCVEISGGSFEVTVYRGTRVGAAQDPIGRFGSGDTDHVGWTWAKGEDALRQRIAHGKEQLKELLLEAAKAGGADVDDVTVFYWSQNHAGLRIAEIAFTKAVEGGGLCGASYMQYDPGHESLLLLCERFVLDWAMGTEDGGLPDDVWRHRIKEYFAGSQAHDTTPGQVEVSPATCDPDEKVIIRDGGITFEMTRRELEASGAYDVNMFPAAGASGAVISDQHKLREPAIVAEERGSPEHFPEALQVAEVSDVFFVRGRGDHAFMRVTLATELSDDEGHLRVVDLSSGHIHLMPPDTRIRRAYATLATRPREE